MLNSQYRMLAGRIDVTNYANEGLVNLISEEPVKKLLIDLYRQVGADFAKSQVKAEQDTSDWMKLFEQYVKLYGGSKIVSIQGETKKQALKIIRALLEEAAVEGWGSDVIASKMKSRLVNEGIKINRYRAQRIARTEVVQASNAGAFIGTKQIEDQYGIVHEKYWIATYDDRTRDTHAAMESQNPKMMDEAFLVGGVWPAQMPHDPDLPPEEVINCRCTIAFKVAEI